jgi:3-methyladenine DNA glycosylase AlkD
MDDAGPRTLAGLTASLTALADPDVAAHAARYFQAGPGGYGEGDRFLGIRVPDLRALARAQRALPLEAVLEHLRSPWHEERLVALLILVEQHRGGSHEARERIHRAYLAHARFVNGWDLVDTSAEHLVGPHVDPAAPTLLDRLAGSDSVWERRIAMLATFHWTRKGAVEPALRIADRLLADPHDLIRKAVGWMLREVGTRDPQRHEAFLAERYRRMPRTMLRTAIERLPEARRQAYLRGEVGIEDRPDAA